MKVEWKRAATFAEIAEALGVPTDHVAAALRGPDDDIWVALWSNETDIAQPGMDEDTPVRSSVLQRDEAGILRVIDERGIVGTLGEMLDGVGQ